MGVVDAPISGSGHAGTQAHVAGQGRAGQGGSCIGRPLLGWDSSKEAAHLGDVAVGLQHRGQVIARKRRAAERPSPIPSASRDASPALLFGQCIQTRQLTASVLAMSPTSPTASSILTKLNLNDAQCRAVCSEAATVAIMAGPGSGKTHTLTSRVVWLIDAMGYQPQDVIVATFTVKAAREMQERIGKALGDGREKRMVLGTFHSIARRYLAAYGRHIGLDQKFAIADDGDSRAIINRICKRLQLGIDPFQARAWISKRKAKGKEWKPTPLQRKRSGEAAEAAKSFELCYNEYQDHLQRSNLLDYDDLLTRCVQLLQTHPACVSNVDAVLIDEYQDTNGIQYELMRLLAQERNRITIVGDPDQSIYGWRSAEIRNLQRLFDDFPNTDQISLEQNYRSSQAILDTALSVIQQDSNRYEKVLKPFHDKGPRPTLRRLKSSTKEAQWIVKEIGRLHLLSGGMLGHGDVSILLRSASLSRNIESVLGQAGIAYKMVGGVRFYDRVEIKILLDYLRVVHQPANNDALVRILNVPKRGLGESTIKALVEEAEQSALSLWALLVKHCRGDRLAKTNIRKPAEHKISGEVIRLILDIQKKMDNSPQEKPYGLVDVIDEVVTRVNLQRHLKEIDNDIDKFEQRWANVQEFRALGRDFTKGLHGDQEEKLPEVEGLEKSEDSDVLAQFLANVALASDSQKKGQEQDVTSMVTISTIHAAKGLEWPIVFVPGAYEGMIPHVRSEDSNEERRLLYVAMTRAQALLYLSCPLSSSFSSNVELSPFVEPVANTFAKIGPDLDAKKLEAIGRILGRDTPTQESIYSKLPEGFSPNDDLFPADPNQPVAADDKPGGDDPMFQDLGRKRPRLAGQSGNYDGDKEPQWARVHGTTTKQASAFMMASQLGSVTTVPREADRVSDAVGRNTAAATSLKQGSTTHSASQGTLLGFVKRDSSSTSVNVEMVAPARPRLNMARVQRDEEKKTSAQPSQGQDATIRPLIDSKLLGHKISSSKTAGHKLSNEQQPKSGKKYPQFSSSPPRPPTPDTGVSSGNTEDNCENISEQTPPPANRPAVNFKSTKMQKLASGVRRPPGLAAPRNEAAALQKLRKPFKPLTISRP
ncbi:mutagen-sensitive-50 [Diaporthe helianthi]|uniref:DNA 3'-5' helicase n=1 Tax=Diaporthe helianthi TaxID=158607 RepID=A0A2P5IAV3_DIAHE|nr:mutagen-sensitive-50 [Diaporthe helianthi]